MRKANIRRAVAAGIAVLATGALGALSGAAANADTGSVAPATGGQQVVTQTGVVSAAVVTGGKRGKQVTAFKVTDKAHTQAWLATGRTVVLRNGAKVPPSAIAKGDRVTVTGTIGRPKDTGKDAGKAVEAAPGKGKALVGVATRVVDSGQK